MNPVSYVKAKTSYFFLRLLIASWTWAGKKYRGIISDRVVILLQRIHDQLGEEALQPAREHSRS